MYVGDYVSYILEKHFIIYKHTVHPLISIKSTMRIKTILHFVEKHYFYTTQSKNISYYTTQTTFVIL